MTHMQFNDKGYQVMKLLDEMGAFALENDDVESFELLMKAKDTAKNAGSRVSSTIFLGNDNERID